MPSTPTPASRLSTRAKRVWSALAGAMTLAGLGMYALHAGPSARSDGLALPALVAAAGPSNLEAVLAPRVALEPDRWQAIVIHHSGRPAGSAATIAQRHQSMNLAGLGHHFVLGNGSGAPDGEIHVGYRWLDQLPGAHASGPDADWFNRNAIGICLVGDGNRRPFTDAQMRRLVALVRTLAAECGIPPERIYLASDVSGATSPGRLFPIGSFREQVASLADAP